MAIAIAFGIVIMAIIKKKKKHKIMHTLISLDNLPLLKLMDPPYLAC